MSFSIDPWNQSAFTQWQQKVDSRRLPQATLLYGVRGLAKKALAQAMIACVFCQHRNNQAPCGQCQDCSWIQSAQHPDALILFPEAENKAIKIDVVRDAIEWLQLSPLRAPYKFLILQQAENLNTPASNALLKTLEEPPSSGLVLLISERPGSLLPTVRSRCQHVSIHLPDEIFLKAWLSEKTGQPEETLPIFPGVGPYALLEEYAEEKSAQRTLCFQVFSDVYAEKSDAIQATEKLKDQPSLDVLRYAYYFIQIQLAEALAKNDQAKIQQLLIVEDAWLKLKSHLITGSNLNWSLQCELFLHQLGNLHATH